MATAAIQHDEALDENTGSASREDLAKVHARALRRFDDTVLPQQEIRAHALICRRFISIPGAMWEGDWGDEFRSIKVEIDKLSKGVEKIVRDYRQNRIVPNFRPAGGSSDPETANTLEGIYRADAYHFNAQQAYDNAFEEAVAGGFGAFRLTNEYADPYDKDSDEQRINPGMLIADADQRVFFDGNSKLYDKSDARFAFVLTADTRDAFEEEYPDAMASWPENLPRLAYDWFMPDVVIKCEYYEVEDREGKLIVLTHDLSKEEQRWWEDEITGSDLAQLRKQGWSSRTTTRKRRRVHKYLMSGEKVLKDQGYIAGSCIPIVPVYGKRWFVDNQERFRGHVSKRMDMQRVLNAKVSKLSEIDALAPREKPIFLSQQMPPNLRDLWAEQEKERHPYALVDPVIDPSTGQIVQMGPIGYVKPPDVPTVTAALLQAAVSFLEEDDQEPDEATPNVSGDAMEIAATRVDAKSDIYLDNMRLSMKRDGEIYLEMAKDGVYVEPGRVVETMSEEGDDGEATLHQAYTDNTGNHMTINDFASGKYKVIADVTEATATRRDKTVRSCLGLANVAVAAQAMDIAKISLLTAIMNLDGEGMGDFQKWGRKQLVTGGVVQPTDDEKEQMQQAAEQAQAQPPDPETLIAHAKAADLAASAGLKQAKAEEVGDKGHQLRADAVLKLAQAHNLGGPAEAPEVPDGLEQAETAAEIGKTAAEADQIRTATAHMPTKLAIEAHNAATNRMKAANDGEAKRIKRGSEL